MDLGLRFSLPGTAASITLLCSISISLPSSPSTSQQILLFQGFLSAADPALSDWGQIHTSLCFMDQTGANQWCSKGNSPTEVEATCWQNRARFEFHVLESVNFSKLGVTQFPPQMICGLFNTVRIKTNGFSFTCSFASPQRYRCPCHSQSLGNKVKGEGNLKLCLWGV